MVKDLRFHNFQGTCSVGVTMAYSRTYSTQVLDAKYGVTNARNNTDKIL